MHKDTSKKRPKSFSEVLQIRADALQAELAKTQLVLWNEIEKRRTAELTLRELEEMHYRVLEATDFGIMVSDYDGNIVTINTAMEKITGHTLEELHNKGFASLLPNSLHRQELHRIHATLEGVHDWEIALKRKDGSICNISLNINPTELYGQNVLVTRVQGISNNKQEEENFKDLMDYQDQIINRISDPLFVINRKHILVHVNDALCSLADIPYDKLIGASPYSQMSPEMATLLFEKDEEIFRTGCECITEDNIVDGTGKTHTLVTKKNLLVKKNGEKQIVGILRDITDYKRLEAQFLQAQKMEAVGVLAGGVAHDFNNLLNVINGYSELVLENLSTDSSLRKDIELIIEAGNRAASLTSQLLAFSRKQLINPETVNLKNIISDMSPLLRRLIGEDLEFAANTQKETGWITADVGQIHQIVMNLAVNARDAMPHGGKLTIETSNVEFDKEYVRIHPESKAGLYVMLAISDNGSGMDEKTKECLFEPFYTTKGSGHGTGLGLSTVYGIVKQSEGWISVYSEPKQGTTFKIYFPRTDGEITEKKEDIQTTDPDRGNETLLVVEDESSVRALINRLLEERGYTVLEAKDGSEALRLARKYDGDIHCVIVDVVMPGISGKDTVSGLEADRPGIKALYISGYTDLAIVRHGILNSSVHFLQKPFTADNLIRKVQTTLQAH